MKTKKERMRATALKIKERMRRLKEICGTDVPILPKFPGMLRNNNEMNACNPHVVKKTNNRKNKTNYRHNTTGGYGEADQYSPHDQRQIDKFKYEEDE